MSLENKLSQFYDKKFRYDGKEFKVADVCVRDGKGVIRTDKRTFVYYESELALFINSVEFIGNSSISQKKAFVPNLTHEAVLVREETNAEKVNKKLMQMFEDISTNPSKENIEKADAMVRVSDAMVKNELIILKYLSR